VEQFGNIVLTNPGSTVRLKDVAGLSWALSRMPVRRLNGKATTRHWRSAFA
jgi:multidrug efflux pump subunit AcrB